MYRPIVSYGRTTVRVVGCLVSDRRLRALQTLLQFQDAFGDAQPDHQLVRVERGEKEVIPARLQVFHHFLIRVLSDHPVPFASKFALYAIS